MGLIGIHALISRRELSKTKYFLRAVFFLLRSRFQQKFSAKIWGSDYLLQANKAKLGIDGYLYIYREEYEPEVRDCLLKYFKDGWLFIDIGANSGYWSRFIASHFSESRIIAFEPAKSTFERLCKNLAQYSDRVRARNTAVSDIEQSLYLFETSDPGSSHLVSAQTASTEQVVVVTLDNESKRDIWLEQCACQCVIKIDVEGFEFHALKGAREFLLMYHPVVVFEVVERYLARAHSNHHEVFTFWEELGYSVFVLARDAEGVHYKQALSANEMLHGQGNLVAIHN